MKIRIYDVGRMKKSTVIEVADGTATDDVAEVIYRTVLKMSALGSRDIECTWDAEAKRGEVIVGGFRLVGHCEVAP